MKSRLQVIVFVIAMIGLYVNGVYAQSDSEMSAMQYFEEGTTAYNAGEYDDAAVYFRRAQELKPSWKLWFNIGQSEAARRKFGLALEAFEKYLAMGGDNVNPARFEEVVSEIRRLRELVGNLEIEGGPKGARVMVDGVVRTELPLEVDLRVTAGISHNLKIVHDDVVIHAQTVTVGSASVVLISLDNKSDPAVGPGDPGNGDGANTSEGETRGALAVNSASGSAGTQPQLLPLKIAMITAWGGTLVTLGLGIGFHAAAGSKESELDDINAELRPDLESGRIPLSVYEAEYDPVESDMNRFDTLSTIMFISSGVLAATAIVTTIVYAKKRKTADSAVSLTPYGLRLQF